MKHKLCLLAGILSIGCTTRKTSNKISAFEAMPDQISCTSADMQPLSSLQTTICESLRKAGSNPVALDYQLLIHAALGIQQVSIGGSKRNITKREWVVQVQERLPRRLDHPRVEMNEFQASLQLHFDQGLSPVQLTFPMISGRDGAIMSSAFGSLAKVRTDEEIQLTTRLVQLTTVASDLGSEQLNEIQKTLEALSLALEKALVANQFPGIRIDDLNTKRIVLTPSKNQLNVHSFEIFSQSGGKIGDIEKGDLTSKLDGTTKVLGRFWSFPLSIN